MASQTIQIDYEVIKKKADEIRTLSDSIEVKSCCDLVGNGNSGDLQQKSFLALSKMESFGRILKELMEVTANALTKSATNISETENELSDSY